MGHRLFIGILNDVCGWLWNKGHFTHEPRTMTMKLWELKRKCPKAVPRHLQNHVVWSQILKRSVKPYVTGPSTKCYFNEFLFMRIHTHDINRINQRLSTFGVPWSPKPSTSKHFSQIYLVYALEIISNTTYHKNKWNLVICNNGDHIYVACVPIWDLKMSYKGV